MTPTRVLFGLLTPGLGGHSQTAVALARVLRDRGHIVDFAVGADAGVGPNETTTTALVRDAGFAAFPVAGLYTRTGHRSFRRHLRDLVRRHAFDVLHWFEMHAGVRDAAVVASDEGRAFVWTVTSGGVPGGYHGLNRVVVYTPEVADDVRRRSPETTVHLLPARVDLRTLTADFVRNARADVRARLAVGDNERLVVRVARCSAVYRRSVRLGLGLAVALNRIGHPARFLHAGYAEDRSVADEIRRLVEDANAAAGRPIAFSLTEDLAEGTRYAAAADVCVGSGRSAIEAIALGRPTIVVWGLRYLGLVDNGNVSAIADTNFQGRHSATVTSDEDVTAHMLGAVVSRLADSRRAASIHEQCAWFVRERYSVERAADTYERLYADRTVRVESAFRYYTNPRHVGTEIFHRLPADIRGGRAVRFLRRSRWWPSTAGAD